MLSTDPELRLKKSLIADLTCSLTSLSTSREEFSFHNLKDVLEEDEKWVMYTGAWPDHEITPMEEVEICVVVPWRSGTGRSLNRSSERLSRRSSPYQCYVDISRGHKNLPEAKVRRGM